MTQDPDNYRIPVRTPGANAARDPLTDRPLGSIGQSDVRVPNPPGTSSYPSRPGPLDRSRDPNVFNPYDAPVEMYNPDLAISQREGDRYLRDSQRDPSNDMLRDDGYPLAIEHAAEREAAARARGQRSMPPMANSMGVEANNMQTLITRYGFSAPVAMAATDSTRYPTRNQDDVLQANAIVAGLRAAQSSRGGRAEVTREPQGLIEEVQGRFGQDFTRQVDARDLAAARAIAGVLSQANYRDQQVLTSDTLSMLNAVKDIRAGRQ